MADWKQMQKKVIDPITKVETIIYGSIVGRTTKGKLVVSKDLFPNFDPAKHLKKLNDYVNKTEGESIPDERRPGKLVTFYGFENNDYKSLGEMKVASVTHKMQADDGLDVDYTQA